MLGRLLHPGWVGYGAITAPASLVRLAEKIVVLANLLVRCFFPLGFAPRPAKE
jgi:hypothetical protein